MPRYKRIVVIGVAHHVTQRGNHQQPVFSSDQDRQIYLQLLQDTATKAGLCVLGYCLMGNHVHLVVVPEREDALAKALGRAHYRYAHYFQAKRCIAGHLWQNRFYSCPLAESHLARAMLYVERNPVRAKMARTALDWPWSSARVHSGQGDSADIIDLADWPECFPPGQWLEMLAVEEEQAELARLERCTFSGKPYGEASFVEHLADELGRSLVLRPPGRPRKTFAAAAGASVSQ